MCVGRRIVNKIVTLEEAIASGKPFKAVSIGPNGHREQTGHCWRLYCRKMTQNEFKIHKTNNPPCNNDILLKCVECSLTVYTVDLDNGYIIEKSEDEFESDALEILSNLSISVSV